MGSLAIGEVVAPGGQPRRPERRALVGKHATLAPLDPQADVADLFDCSHGPAEVEALWTYMPVGPFASRAAMQDQLTTYARLDDPLFFTVIEAASQHRVGVVSFMNIVPEMRRLELGNIWYSPRVQRTPLTTEVAYLMLCRAFDELDYRRVEWKCDSLNARSRKAALRLGFSYEGLFRQHLVVKGRNRDTTWFSMLDAEWPRIKKHFVAWLYEGESRPLSELNA